MAYTGCLVSLSHSYSSGGEDGYVRVVDPPTSSPRFYLTASEKGLGWRLLLKVLGRLATIDQYIIEVQPLYSFEYSAFMLCGHIDESQWINLTSCCPGCTLYVTLKNYILFRQLCARAYPL